MVRTGTRINPIYERTVYIDGIFEYHIYEGSTTHEKNYVHIMDDSSRIAMVRITDGTTYPDDIPEDIVYNLDNEIGSSTIRLKNDGTIIDREEYYPFGDSSLRTFTMKRYRYVGREKDLESGLYYYGARYYAAWTCRFISVDPLAGKYAHITPYNYADNNPINDYDIDGMQDQNTEEGGSSKPTPTQLPFDRFKTAGVEEGQVHMIPNAIAGGPALEFNYHSGSKFGEAGWYAKGDYDNLVSNMVDAYERAGAQNTVGNLTKFAGINQNIITGDGWKQSVDKVRYKSYSGSVGNGFRYSIFDRLSGEQVGGGWDSRAAFMASGATGPSLIDQGTFNALLYTAPIPIFKSSFGGTTFYRAMSYTEFAALEGSGGLSYMAGKELFVSKSAKYARDMMLRHPEKYNVLVQFNMKPGAMNYFKQVGVMHRTAAGAKGWASRGNLLWKSEGAAINLGIQQNIHMFNPWIKNFKIIK